MNSIWKRSLAMLLSLVMVIGMLPMNAFADEGDEVAVVNETESVETVETTHTHSYTSEVTTPAKCESDGVLTTTYTCDCGLEPTTEAIPAAGHAWGEGVETAASCTQAGAVTYTCGTCGATRSDEIAATGHTFVEGKCACGEADPDWVAPVCVCGEQCNEMINENCVICAAGGTCNGKAPEVTASEVTVEEQTITVTETFSTPAANDSEVAEQSNDVAKIGETGYTSLADAVREAEDNDTITLLADVDSFPAIDKPLTIKGDGEEAEVAINCAIAENFSDVNGTVTFENLIFNNRVSTENASNDQSEMTLKFVGCTFNVPAGNTYAIQGGASWNNDVLGELIIEDCAFNTEATSYVKGYMIYAQCVENVTVTGTTLDGNNAFRGAIHLGDSTEYATVATIGGDGEGDGNTIKNFARGVQIGNRVEGSVVDIVGNTFENINAIDGEEESAALYIHEVANAAKVGVLLKDNTITGSNDGTPVVFSENATGPISDFVTTFTGNTVNGDKVTAETEEVVTIGEPAVFTADDLLGKEEELPNATVTVQEPTTLQAGEYNIFDISSNNQVVSTEDLTLQIVMNFKANDTYEEALAGAYGDWLCDFSLEFNGLAEGSITADNCYLAGNYGTFGWIAIPTDGMDLESGVEYPVVSKVVQGLTYAEICNSVKEFTAAIYIDPAILEANPDFSVTLKLNMTDPETEEVVTIGEPAVFTADDLLGEEEDELPNATVTVMERMTLNAETYNEWNGSSLSTGTVDRPLQAVMNFKANDTFEEAQAGKYAKYKCDFYLTFDNLTSGTISGEGSYLAGNYGNYGWIVIPADTLTIKEGEEYPVVSNYDANLTYENICDYVKDFTAALYVNEQTLLANPDMTVKLTLKMTSPDDSETLVIGEEAVYTAAELYGEHKPEAEIAVQEPMTLTVNEHKHNIWLGGADLKADDQDRPLQAIVNFQAKESLAAAQLGGYGDWLCDFYLTFDGLKTGSISGEGSYLAGNYGDYGWIVIPADTLTIEEGEEYPVVSNYDPKLTYENICDYVKDFTAALYVNEQTLLANPDMTVKLTLKMTSPDDSETLVIGEEAVYTAAELYGEHKPEAEITVQDPITLPADEYSVWTGSLSNGTVDRPLQAIVNFKAKETQAEAKLGGYGDWLCDFYLSFEGLKNGSFVANNSYLAGNYGSYGWIVIPADTLTIEEGEEYPVVSNYDANLTYENICDYVKDFTAAIYLDPEIVKANPELAVTVELKMTDREDNTQVMSIGAETFTAEDLLAASGYVAQNTRTDVVYTDVSDALDAAEAGDTVILLADYTETNIAMVNGVTLDLNGYELTTMHAVAFADNFIIDSTGGNGLLKTTKGLLVLQKNNPYLSVWNGNDGYVFTKCTSFQEMTSVKEDGSLDYIFLPKFDEKLHASFKAGAETSTVDLYVDVYWTSSNDLLTSKRFHFTDELVNDFFSTYNPATGKYGGAFYLNLTGVPEGLTLDYTVSFISKTAVEYTLPEIVTNPDGGAGNGSTNTPSEDNKVTQEVTLASEGSDASAVVPVGTQLEEGATALTLNVSEMERTTSNITVESGETMMSLDVHVEGVAANNTVPVLVTLPEITEDYLNQGNLKLYHVENGETIEMTQVFNMEELDAHNEYYYDANTRTITMALATFSEIAMLSEDANKWKGEVDHSWYNADAKELTIANADQLWSLSQIVGGMAEGIEQDSFSGKTINLIADINLGDGEEDNDTDKIFYPIGYNSSDGKYEKTGVAVTTGFYTFEGTFDGNGHTISNIYLNTWEMKGDHNWYDAELQYYRDGMGLFGKVYGGTVKNLTVKNFKSDGEIATTGVIAAYADGATFENISIFDCNPRVYNIGNGGIVGCVGWYAKEADLKTTFTNITVDNSNKISALWGTYDAACGGIVGQYYPTSGQGDGVKNEGIHFENCHVSAVMDVYNDVCGNYQYYAYRYTGMMIGSIRENETISGYVRPKMDGISAENCTVNFGTWNDYYYCELVDNTTASYTHDHQMSRLTEIKAINGTTITYLDGTTGTVPASGRANYVIVDYTKGHGTNNATCCHFKDGAVWTHDMGGIQTGVDENGDGQDDLKEDKQHIYLEFKQLFTGYGWGVTSVGLESFAGINVSGITEGTQEESVVKFTAKGGYTQLKTEKEYKLSELFAENTENTAKVPVNSANVTVGVTYTNGAENTVAPTFEKKEDWKESTLAFTSEGEVTIAIQDYNFCKITEWTVTIGQTEETNTVERFEIAFDHDDVAEGKQNYVGDYIYRVGSKNDVAVGNLFSAIEDEKDNIGAVSVAVETLTGDATGTYTANDTDWTKGTIDFNGTGTVKVVISDDNFSEEADLTLEVVDATNITTATGTSSGGNFVLLSNVNASNYVYYTNSTLYGNGFTYSLEGAPTQYSSSHGHGVIMTSNATIDNVKIVGDVYESYGAYSNQDCYNAAVDIVGETVIQNSYIANCATPVNVRNNVTIKNTTLYGGAIANLLIKGGTVTLEDVTTANFNDGRALTGMGIVVHTDATDTAKLILNGELKQYNFINETDVPSDANAKVLFNTMFDDSCSQYHFGSSPNRSVNTGILSMTTLFNKDDITDNANTGYVGQAVSAYSVNGYVYTQPNTSGSVDNNLGVYSPEAQGAIPPTVTFDHTVNEVAKTEGSNDYCYEENGTVSISMDDGDSFNWNTAVLTATKLGNTLNYTVAMNGADYTGKSITFNTAGDYEVVYKYTDPYNYRLNTDGETESYSVEYTKIIPINVSVIKETTKHATFTFGSSNQTVEQITVDNKTYLSATNKTVNGTSWGCMTVGTSKIYYPIVEAEIVQTKASSMFNTNAEVEAYFYVFDGTIAITDYENDGTGNSVTYNSSTTTMPSGLKVVKGNYQKVSDNTTWYSSYNDTSLSLTGAENVFKYAGSNAVSSTPTTKNDKLCYKSDSGLSTKNRSEYYTLVQYQYTDNAGAIYYYYVGYHMQDSKNVAPDYSSGCFTGDTLITLADGSTKRMDQITFEDQLLAWDFNTGKYAVTTPSLIDVYEESEQRVITLKFSDGTDVRMVVDHGFFDVAENNFVFLDETNVDSYIGHEFVKAGENGTYGTVKLDDYDVTVENVSYYAIQTAIYNNCIANGMLTLTSPPEMLDNDEWFDYFEIGEGMKYDEAKMQADIEKYGLYTYEEFADLVTYEQFIAFNGPYLKVLVGRGVVTYEQIIDLIGIYVNP